MAVGLLSAGTNLDTAHASSAPQLGAEETLPTMSLPLIFLSNLAVAG